MASSGKCRLNIPKKENTMNAFSSQRTALAFIGLAAAIAIISGCTSSVQSYSASPYISTLNPSQMHKISVGEFTAKGPGKSSIACRAIGPVATPNEENFEKFIREALIQEMNFAGIYSAEASMRLQGRLEKIDFDSAIGGIPWIAVNKMVLDSDYVESSWTIVMVLSAPGHPSFRVGSVHRFPGRFDGLAACRLMAREFVPAVQLFINKVFNDPNFQKILTSK